MGCLLVFVCGVFAFVVCCLVGWFGVAICYYFTLCWCFGDLLVGELVVVCVFYALCLLLVHALGFGFSGRHCLRVVLRLVWVTS